MADPVLITERSLIAGVAEEWRATYGSRKPEIGGALAALDPETATAADVSAIIGNESWTRVPRCDGCGNRRPGAVVKIGDAMDFESNTAHLCEPCVRAALVLFPATED